MWNWQESPPYGKYLASLNESGDTGTNKIHAMQHNTTLRIACLSCMGRLLFEVVLGIIVSVYGAPYVSKVIFC